MGNVLKNRGFSLIELMVVIAIIAILVNIAIPKIGELKSRARDAEPNFTLNALYTAVHSYYNDENNRFHVGGAGYINAEVGRNNFTTETSCNTPNMFGFKLTDCRHIHFAYGVGGSGIKKSLGVYAIEGSLAGVKRVYPKCNGASFWTASNGSIRHAINPRNSSDCMGCFSTLVTAALGGTNMDFDTNGDEVINVFDTTWLMTTFSAGGNPIPHFTYCPF